MPCPCFIVPPHLLRSIAESTSNPQHVRQAAQASLVSTDRVTVGRQSLLSQLADPTARRDCRPAPFITEAVLARLAASEGVDEHVREQAKRDLDHLQAFMAKPLAEQQASLAAAEDDKKKHKGNPYRAVYDAKKTMDQSDLPGELVRAEGEGKVKDEDVNFAYDNVGLVVDFYKKQFQWKSIDNKNADIISSVHFGKHFENAFWDPEQRQMVFGDGGEFLGHFTNCIDVIGHELTHAITEHTSPLQYSGQPGALNEHISDVFGIMVKQSAEKEKADEADWLVGEGCLLPGVKGTALRSMKNPGTAYNDPRLGKDPQVDNMSEYETTFEDNGGVHIYSGIPNKAFYLAAVAFGGYSWEKAGQIWWKAMTSGRVPSRCTFQQFADVTVECATDEFGDEAGKKVRKAWDKVGVTRKV
ncbi:hypothetical protein CDD80_3624 [Ophiocordyceps camponoti-rufipedis]|uniref:Peptidase M4 C-terminal domain-containing protein n=1 Tax=Ophiocordyceps camponoti-rufipedis TaxID=2004952 RepID=A0A2C5Z3G4_9HYPO|nr:hypothetical protein CDD80_3624 [Ophiocordyceps camponoti-rufipedis]